ncbi:hypothetical protein WJX73_003430 [Symbiochloris irregularis]|uniref:Uncharacterized protein n=1 Tax=Symbiochloris irregularis TaxID=706552 RepID=A0AAW1NTL4_9CHLO
MSCTRPAAARVHRQLDRPPLCQCLQAQVPHGKTRCSCAVLPARTSRAQSHDLHRPVLSAVAFTGASIPAPVVAGALGACLGLPGLSSRRHGYEFGVRSRNLQHDLKSLSSVALSPGTLQGSILRILPHSRRQHGPWPLAGQRWRKVASGQAAVEPRVQVASPKLLHRRLDPLVTAVVTIDASGGDEGTSLAFF